MSSPEPADELDPFQRAITIVDLGAIERNCALLCSRIGTGTELCAVVKANGYGHGMIQSATAALRGGAGRLAVATATEAFELRAQFPDTAVLVMGALTGAELDVALQARAELALWREGFREALATRAEQLGFRPRVHVKYDTGMGRLGHPDPKRVEALIEACAADERLELAGLWTHFATADEVDDGYLQEQLACFLELAAPLRERHPGLRLHAANSAATLREPAAHLDMVRCGIAIYGLDPFGLDAAAQGLEPALSLRSYVADVKRFEPGSSAGYGRRWRAEVETVVGLIPIGYGDGVRRGLSDNCEVLVEGVRRALVGAISMDNVTVDLGPGQPVPRGTEAVLIGAQGEQEVSVEEWARRLGTINYEITCGISSRVPRAYRR